MLADMATKLIAAVQAFLDQDLADHDYFMDREQIGEADATAEEFAVIERAAVTETASGEVAIAYVEGPGFFFFHDSFDQLVNDAADRARAAVPELAGCTVQTSVVAADSVSDAAPPAASQLKSAVVSLIAALKKKQPALFEHNYDPDDVPDAPRVSWDMDVVEVVIDGGTVEVKLAVFVHDCPEHDEETIVELVDDCAAAIRDMLETDLDGLADRELAVECEMEW